MCSIKCVPIVPNNDIDKLLYKVFINNLRPGYAEFGDSKTMLTITYQNIADEIENFEVRDSDTFVVSYPKAGTTWCQEMAWLICNKLDFEGANTHLSERFPFFEATGIYDYNAARLIKPDFKFPPHISNSIKYINEMKSPRFIKTHLPWSMLPKQIRDGTRKPKIIYVRRNAKDVCVSYYYHCVLREGFNGDFNDFSKLYLEGRVVFGLIWDHIREYWQQRNRENILYLTYEDMSTDLPVIIRKVAKFLKKDLTQDQINILTKHLSFESMKKNPSCNYEVTLNRSFYDNKADGIRFMRSGKVGSYKADMSPEMIEIYDQWIKKHLEDIGVKRLL